MMGADRFCAAAPKEAEMRNSARLRMRSAAAIIVSALGVAVVLHAQQPATPVPGTPASPAPRAGGPPVPQTGAPFDPAKVPAGLSAPKMWTAQQDHQDMMDQLGIKALRPGPSG